MKVRWAVVKATGGNWQVPPEFTVEHVYVLADHVLAELQGPLGAFVKIAGDPSIDVLPHLAAKQAKIKDQTRQKLEKAAKKVLTGDTVLEILEDAVQSLGEEFQP